MARSQSSPLRDEISLTYDCTGALNALNNHAKYLLLMSLKVHVLVSVAPSESNRLRNHSTFFLLVRTLHCCCCRNWLRICSDELLLICTTVDGEVLHVRQVARQLIVTWSRSDQLVVSSNFRPLARSKAKAGSFSLQRFTAVRVLAWSRNVELVQLGLQLNAHGETWVLIFDGRRILLVSTSSRSLQTG